MKIFALILIFAFVFSACAKYEEFNRVSEQKVETVNQQFEQPDAPPILEITQNVRGMQDVTGKSLFFNLYNDGIIEFEVQDEEKKAMKNSADAEEINVLKRAKISEPEMRKFVDLFASEDFQKTKNEYVRNCTPSDVLFEYQITFTTNNNQKIITLNDNCGANPLKNPRLDNNLNFPKVLTELLILTEKTRQKHASQ